MMNQMDTTAASDVNDEAARWFLIVHDMQDAPAHQVQEWLAWMAADDAHRRAFEEVAQVWHSITPAIIERHSSGAPEDGYDGSIPVRQWARRRAVEMPNEAVPRRRWLRPAGIAALAAAISCVVVLMMFGPAFQPGREAISAGTFDTQAGEHLQLQLADGSSVILGGHSKLVVAFTADRRSLRLEAGEAYFRVHKDTQRPFEVRALGGSVIAVGTQFNVRSVEDRVTVTVTEGSVRVADSDTTETGQALTNGAAAEGLRLRSGEQVSYRPDAITGAPDVTAVKQVDPAESARWREGWLVYRQEPLEFVLADVARYTNLQFTIKGAVAQLPFSGAVFKDSVEEWIAALPEVSPVTVQREGNHILVGGRSANDGRRLD